MVARGKRITKLAGISLDMSLADVSPKVREAEIAAKIKYLFKSQKIKSKKVIVGLSGLHCLSRPVTLPQLPRAMLDEAMMREAKRVLPVPPEQLYISWQIISATGGEMQAFMIAIPRQIADTLLRVLHEMGLKPYLMDIKPLALARLVGEATAIVVDVQSREFDIVIMADGVPQPVRTVPFPEEELSLPDKLSMVKDELERTIQFYNSNNPEKPILPSVNVFVSGELAGEPEIYEFLASELGHPVLPLSSPLKCPKQLDPSHYLVNIGLALKELRRGAVPLLPNLNTLPVSYQPKPLSLFRIMALPATAIAIGLIVLLAMTIQDAVASIDSVHSKLNATNFILEQKQSQKKELMENITALEQKLADTEAAGSAFTAALDSLGEQGDRINGDLEASVNNLINGISLDSISHSGQGLNINGQSLSEVEVLEYARNLDASGRFSKVTISSIMRTESEGSDNVSVGMGFGLALELEESE
jgi:type IV pilus assembly protein PilM